MPSYTISSLTSSTRMAKYIQEQRSTIDKLTIESATKKYADMGLELGGRVGYTVSMRSDYSQLSSQVLSNKQAIMRLDVINLSLENSRKSAESFRASLIGLRDTGLALSTSANLAQTEMANLVSNLNASVGGVSVFGGTNVGKAPLSEFETTPPSAAKSAIEAAFQAEFGYPTTDPRTKDITSAQMTTFLKGRFADELNDTNWKANWSQATDDTMTISIADGVKMQGSASANQQGIRDMAAGFAMISEFGKLDLSPETKKALVDEAITKLYDGTTGTGADTAQVGATKARILASNTDLEAKQLILNKSINDLENVDPYRTSIELKEAMTQLEANFSVTSKLSKLNLLAFI